MIVAKMKFPGEKSAPLADSGGPGSILVRRPYINITEYAAAQVPLQPFPVRMQLSVISARPNAAPAMQNKYVRTSEKSR